MKLWDSLTACLLLLLSAVHAGPLLHRRGSITAESPPIHTRLSVTAPRTGRTHTAGKSLVSDMVEEIFPNEFEDMVNFIKVTAVPLSTPSFKTSPKEKLNNRTRHKRERKGKKGRGKGTKRRNRVNSGRGQGCVLKQIHLNVTDLGLGYRSSEEMIFRYCSGPCRKSETNYDKILYNLLHNKKLPAKDTPSQVCCRPIAFDDNLSFLDDNLIYHTVRKHSARKCGCV